MPEPDRELSRLLREHEVPGAVVGVLDGDETTISAAGVADMSTGEPLTTDTRFAIGSLAKPMVATAVVRLGLPLDDPVAARVPELEGVAWAERATLRDLLGNRARLPLASALEFGDFPGDDDGVLSRFAAAVATAEPAGDFWSYANAGWALLGRALETATGLSWRRRCANRCSFRSGSNGRRSFRLRRPIRIHGWLDDWCLGGRVSTRCSAGTG